MTCAGAGGFSIGGGPDITAAVAGFGPGIILFIEPIEPLEFIIAILGGILGGGILGFGTCPCIEGMFGMFCMGGGKFWGATFSPCALNPGGGDVNCCCCIIKGFIGAAPNCPGGGLAGCCCWEELKCPPGGPLIGLNPAGAWPNNPKPLPAEGRWGRNPLCIVNGGP